MLDQLEHLLEGLTDPEVMQKSLEEVQTFQRKLQHRRQPQAQALRWALKPHPDAVFMPCVQKKQHDLKCFDGIMSDDLRYILHSGVVEAPHACVCHTSTCLHA